MLLHSSIEINNLKNKTVMSFKRVKVVMLPTNEKAINTLVKCQGDNREYLSYVKSFYKVPLGEAFEGIKGKATYQGGDFVGNIIQYNHLYFLSDEEIKEGDWVYSVLYGIGHVEKDYGNSLRPLTVKFGNSEVRQSYHRNGFYDNLDVSAHNCKKIIATTDKSLLDTIHNPAEEFKHIWELPQPSQSFIEKYVEEYNKGNIITEVMVEYEPIGAYANPKYDSDYQLKVNPKDNTITIRKIKDSWNREEVIELCRKAMICDTHYDGFIHPLFDQWIEENL